MGILEALGLRKKPEEPAKGITVKVGPRDTLRSLSKKYYGTEDKWTVIFEVNEWRIDGDELAPGQDCFIPDAEEPAS